MIVWAIERISWVQFECSGCRILWVRVEVRGWKQEVGGGRAGSRGWRVGQVDFRIERERRKSVEAFSRPVRLDMPF
jgi:hypothetical protein